MVYGELIYHPVVTKLLKFLDSSASREKLLRLLQYLCRFLTYYTFRRNVNIETIQLIKKIQSSIAISRKPLRFLKNLPHLKNLNKIYSNELLDSTIRIGDLIKNFGYALYFQFDTLQWLKLLGLLTSKNSGALYFKVDKLAANFWLIGLTGSIITDLRNLKISYDSNKALLNEINSQEKTDGSSTSDEKLIVQNNELILKNNEKINLNKRDLFKNVLDSLIALKGSQLIDLNDGVLGFAGIITSIIGIEDIWNATKA
ncbi:unnamed protein product [[Candida] boidinii]|uniref:Unnamed protein product n=1 Tax=Candida boidinii TaxID=5477 RepID=A0A9W6W8Y0_CANBO|nr:hypothetical protein BVG19_g1806 [[Candida] boidinii]OWB53153.1 hypothetical protein B5S27_g4745 [[Candida] boidinii]OWB65156.1 hypothetical protein B5S30_g479 [[Candida] boidinii]OWB82552.1 hypothetical protein B5S33_g1178 [[Candida] boidinii]GME68936.1 unnamed protein product [[Candida] boidinii]